VQLARVVSGLTDVRGLRTGERKKWQCERRRKEEVFETEKEIVANMAGRKLSTLSKKSTSVGVSLEVK